jgi:hypothetical protein
VVLVAELKENKMIKQVSKAFAGIGLLALSGSAFASDMQNSPAPRNSGNSAVSAQNSTSDNETVNVSGVHQTAPSTTRSVSPAINAPNNQNSTSAYASGGTVTNLPQATPPG